MKGFGKKLSAKASTKKDSSKAAESKKNKSSKDVENVNASEMSRSTSADSASQFSKTLSSLASLFSIEVGLPGDEGVDVAHKLPPTKEELAQQQEKKRKRILLALVAVFLALIIFLVVFFLTRGSDTKVASDPRDRLSILEDVLDPAVTPLDKLRDNSTAHHEAIMWFAFDDPTYPDLSSLSDELIIARYVSALLYFSTNGPGWRQQLNFMSDAPVCEWNDGGLGDVEEGIVCDSDDAGRVDGIVVDLNNLQGTLPTELAALPYLKNLGLGTSLNSSSAAMFEP